jgi:hypothetical protein
MSDTTAKRLSMVISGNSTNKSDPFLNNHSLVLPMKKNEDYSRPGQEKLELIGYSHFR